MRKILIDVVLIISSCILASGTKLTDGVDLRNSVDLMLSEFLIISVLLFHNFGQCEKYLNGFGKYLLIRHKKRHILMLGIYIKTIVYILFWVFTKLIFYIAVVLIKNETINVSLNDYVSYVLMLILIFSLLSCIQINLELNFSSAVGVSAVMVYYLFSVIFGGMFVQKGIYIPILLLFPNFSMNYRTNVMGIDKLFLYMILLIGIAIMIFANQIKIRRKDIF